MLPRRTMSIGMPKAFGLLMSVTKEYYKFDEETKDAIFYHSGEC